MDKRGSIVLETAVVFTAFLIILTVALTAMNVQKTDIVMQNAIEQSSEDLESAMPFVRFAAEGINIMTASEYFGGESKEAYDNLCRLSDSFTQRFGVSAEELVIDGVLGEALKNDIASEYMKRSCGSSHYVPDSILVEVCYDPGKNCLEELITYKINTIFGDIERSHYSVVPFYGIYNGAINRDLGSLDCGDDKKINPWDLGNLQRGEYLEQENGSNLPHLFPVISKFEDGVAESYLSIDMTKDSYKDDKKLDSVIRRDVDRLKSFDGARANIRGEIYEVKGEDIKSRVLNIIIPENTPQERVSMLMDSIMESDPDGIFVNILKSGTSN